MVKLQKGKGAPNKNSKPRPLFPPGELPLFGPPPAFARRPPGPPPPPPPPRPRPLHHGGGYGPPGPPPPMSMRPLPPLVGGPPPPRPPIPPHPMRRRGPPGPPLPPPPLMGLPPRPHLGPPPPPFMRGPPRRPPGGPSGLHPPPNFRGRNDKMAANRRFKPNNKVKKKKSNRKPDDEGSFLCEPCDRSWFTAEELEEHLSCHEDCGAEHCSFSAHPKIVALHYKMQHASGLFEKIPKTYDAQDIAAWIAERKKRYPTKDKVEEKEAALKERVARGEVLEIPNSQPKLSAQPKDIRSKRREFKNNAHSPRNKPQLQRRNVPPKPQHFSIGNLRIEVIDGLPPDYETNKREAAIEREKALAAVEEMKNREDQDQDFISEDDWEVDDGLNVETPKAMSSVLSALSAAYDSNISDDDGPPIELNTVVSRAIVEETPNIERESECTGDPQTFQSVNDHEGVSLSRKRTRKRPAKGSDKKPRLPPPAPSSLLQMLLAHDIRKERNQILQCVRFIVDNDYFDQECRNLASTIASTPVSVS